jgi:tripeptidyl-peptidase-1
MKTLAAVTALLQTVSADWSPTGRALHPTDDKIGLTFGLKLNVQSNNLKSYLQRLSDPTHPDYGHYLSTNQINQLFPTTTPNAAREIEQWIRTATTGSSTGSSSGAVVDTSAYGFVTATLATSDVEKLFDVKITEYVDEKGRAVLRRSRTTGTGAESTVSTPHPAAIASFVDFISGLDYFPILQRKIKKREESTLELKKWNLDYGTDPPSLRARYKIGTEVCTHPNTTQATANFLGEGYSDDDLKFFFEVFYNKGEGTKVSKVVGPNNDPSLEASLDIQYISSIGQGATTWWISDDDVHNQNEPFLAYMVALSKTENIPSVHSISYADMEWSVNKNYTDRVDLEFMKAGIRGISILIASGDDGAGCDNSTTSFVVEWPGTSAYVTAVGATTVPMNGESVGESAGEAAAGLSGGGFSILNQHRPSWQNQSVISYLNELKDVKNAPPTSFYTTEGRAVPDVSAMVRL